MKYTLILLLLLACGPAGKLRRAEKLIAKAELLGAKVTTDTIYIEKKVIVPEYRWDTVGIYQTLTDTIIVNNEKIVTRIKIDTVTKTWYVDNIIKGDTVFVTMPAQVNNDITVPKQMNPWPWIIAALVLVAIILLIRK